MFGTIHNAKTDVSSAIATSDNLSISARQKRSTPIAEKGCMRRRADHASSISRGRVGRFEQAFEYQRLSSQGAQDPDQRGPEVSPIVWSPGPGSPE
eukprot:8278298-Pyramimonas_sp.AAC.1